MRDIKNVTNFLDKLVSISRFKKYYFIEGNKLILPELDISVLNQFKDFLILNSNFEELDEKYYYRPDLFCLEKYGSVDYYFIIMYINDVFSFADFYRNKIYVPSLDAIDEVVNFVQTKINSFERINKTLEF